MTPPSPHNQCQTCDGPLSEHPEPGYVRFEWAETARPEGWWYYRTTDLQGESVLKRNHPFAPSPHEDARADLLRRMTFSQHYESCPAHMSRVRNVGPCGCGVVEEATSVIATFEVAVRADERAQSDARLAALLNGLDELFYALVRDDYHGRYQPSFAMMSASSKYRGSPDAAILDNIRRAAETLGHPLPEISVINTDAEAEGRAVSISTP